MLRIILSFGLFLFLQHAACEDAPLVESNVGPIKGLKATDGDYYMYKGIPFAKVNHSNPFGPSTPYPPFEEPFEAYNDSAMCPQVFFVTNQIMGTLDCLNLNVFVPASASTSKSLLPVMVWIYGGAFLAGSAGVFGPRYLVQHDVILVVINYRTGPYGFMCLDIPEVSGNQGLKDQYIALKWVKDNIEAFGGDPDRITLAGQSAGGHSVNLHLVSDKEKLYKKVILQSASNLLSNVLFGANNTEPLNLAKYLGFETNDTREALDYLSGIDTDSVIAAATNLSLPFNPCKETLFDSVEPFLTTTWIGSKVPKVKNMPILMGFNELEVLDLFAKNDSYFTNLTIINDNLKEVFDFTDQRQIVMEDSVSRFYYGDEEIDVKVKWNIIRYRSDFQFIHPVHISLRRYLNNGAGDIYFYMFSYVGRMNDVVTTTYDENASSGHLCCAGHSDELPYLFNLDYKPEPSEEDEVVIERMTTMWTNFVKYSDPTPKECELSIKWIPVTKDTYNYLHIDSELSFGRRPLRERMTYWDLFYSYNGEYQRGYEEK